MNKTQAIKTARLESSIYRQGSGWIVSTWDPAVRMNRLSNEMPYLQARQGLKDWRDERVKEMMS